ncbi:MAG: UDP-N-acetylmuramoyl-L-alanine--D-glutamate ligase, partial [Hylemonella sp.]|nr:UDP-N-acetylmuramoyl-L-alanine--D-glutamate ligase [Hylemonella sp.]
METLKDQHVLILGLGASGLAMARWCARCGARVTVVDTREAPPQLGALREGVPQAEFRHGGFEAALVEGSDVRAVFKSPGLTPASVAPLWTAAQAMGLWVGGELDLFVRALADLKQASAVEPEQEILTQETPAAPIATAEPDDEALPSEASDEEASPLPVDEE